RVLCTLPIGYRWIGVVAWWATPRSGCLGTPPSKAGTEPHVRGSLGGPMAAIESIGNTVWIASVKKIDDVERDRGRPRHTAETVSERHVDSDVIRNVLVIPRAGPQSAAVICQKRELGWAIMDGDAPVGCPDLRVVQQLPIVVCQIIRGKEVL